MTTNIEDKRALNTDQKKAVEFGAGPLLIIAGAGTGKTTVITERIKYLITSGKANPSEILGLTFTEKASREMEERVDIALPYGTTQMWISTFHAFCDRILKNEGIQIGLNPSYKLMTEGETILFLRKNLFQFNLKYFRPLGNPTKFIGGIIQHFSRLKDEDISPIQYSDWVKTQISKLKSQNDEGEEELEKFKELAQAYLLYEELKVKEGVADYSDLISNTLRLFRMRKNVLGGYQKLFKYILIDEFQDTNFAQNELAVLLAGERKNITVVGDDDQAIYRWRGAAISNMIQFRSRFPKATIVVLTKNYRSTKEILDRSYDLIQNNNPDRLEVKEKIDKKLESMRRVRGVPVKLLYEQRVENEAEVVAEEINAKCQMLNAKWSDFAILVRANSHAEPFTRALMRSGIPYQFLGPGQLFKQSEVKDLIAYLKVLYNFEDNVAVFRVLSMEWLDIPAKDIALLINYARKYGISLFDACQVFVTDGQEFNKQFQEKPVASDDAKEKIRKFIEMTLRHLSLIKKETAGQILYYFLSDTGLLTELATYKTNKDEKIAGNIAKFFSKIKTFEVEHADASIFVVVEWIDLAMELGESPLATDTDWSENNAVNILTIHSSKGLEFPIVFLVNLVNTRFPTIERREQIPIPESLIKEILPTGDHHMQEERRLFYVGMTRARDYLYFTAAKYYGEGKREKKLSPFVHEVLGVGDYAATQSKNSDTQQLFLLDWQKEEEKQRPIIRQPVNYLSYSQLSTFSTCPLQYKYRYILKIPVPPTSALVFGDAMHKTIRAFYELARFGDNPSKETLLTLLDKNWSSIGYRNKAYEEKMKAQGKFLLAGFFEKAYDPKNIPLELEQPFRIKITPTLKLGGKIDRVDNLPDGKIEIIDYKTGQALKNRNVKDDLQLTVYALAATDEGLYKKIPEQVIVSFYFFEGQEKISATRTKEQLEEAKKVIADKALEISKSDFYATPGKHCDFCEFRLICEAWQ